jgi:CMP-N,N'-diacetyllegionaminic acid synthase
MRVLYVIPARGGSKGVPMKNIRLLANRPLISYTIEAAKSVADPSDICVSTDSTEIKCVAEGLGVKVPFLRPAELSSDDATSESVLIHALEYFRNEGVIYDYVVMLQPTSPLRNGVHLSEALELVDHDTEMIVSVKETQSNPYYVLYEEDSFGVLRMVKEATFTKRQDCPTVYELNGAIYIIKVSSLLSKGYKNLERRKYVMEDMYSIDIDTSLHFDFAELVLKKYILGYEDAN